ncbi:YJR107W [Zygosaccharomyces parabailii]|nr:YJR107W [Zygosaccharomyces parabailii]CDH09264.1 related to Putative lipase YJR107W [Zygosaccharomyces bailii ISA1307]
MFGILRFAPLLLVIAAIQSANLPFSPTDLVKRSNDYGDNDGMKELQAVEFTSDVFERLLYFSKVSAVVSCISDNSLIPDKTLKEGGCPAHLAFCSDEDINPTANRTRVELVLTAGKGELGTGCLLVDHAREVVIIALRASTTRQDWLSDFTIYPTRWEPSSKGCYQDLVDSGAIRPCEGCKIHRGFYKFSETLAELFLDKIEHIFSKYPKYRLVITGHSLGAALASIAGIELKLRGYNPVVVTYANPLMFNSQMKEWVDDLFETESVDKHCRQHRRLDLRKGYFRVVHNEDYIPMVPPNYKEAGIEIFIKKKEVPHEITDLEYRGTKGYYDEPDSEEDLYVKSALLENGDWLHRKEHCSYFIFISGCAGF